MEKPYFLKRLAGYLIDAVIILIIQSLLMSAMGINTTKYEALSKKQQEILNSAVQGDESAVEEFKENNYNLAKNKYNLINSVTEIIIIFLYFGIFATFNGGRTIGKQILKFKVVKEDLSVPSYVRMIFRTVIAYGIIFVILNLAGVYFLSKDEFFFYTGILNLLQMGVLVSSVIMILFRNDGRGIHDLLTKTKAITIE